MSMRSGRLAAARAIATHTYLEWALMVLFCGRRCVRCGARRADDYVEKDHVVPLYQGGSDGIENLQPLCARCNTSKGPEAIDHRPAGWREYLSEHGL